MLLLGVNFSYYALFRSLVGNDSLLLLPIMEHAFVYLYQAMILIIWHTLLLIGIRFHCTTPKAYFKLAWDSVFTSRKGSEHKGKRKDKKHFQSTECGRAYTCVYIARFLRWNRHSCACHCVASENLTWVVFIPTCIQPDVLLCSPFCLLKPGLRNFRRKTTTWWPTVHE